MPEAVIVVPCYNEAARLDEEQLAKLLVRSGVHLVLVDDGSTDGTQATLRSFVEKNANRAECLALPRNVGKGEAVRAGLVRALVESPVVVGFADADFAVPATEVLRLLEVALRGPAQVVLGSRVRMLGSDIRRTPVRHYLGRVFATFASLALELPVYDTQCGAKFFRVTEVFRAALGDPFTNRWTFDVELLARLLSGARGGPEYSDGDFVEVPLHAWADVAGSRLRPGDAARIGLSLLGVARRMRRRSRK